MSTQTWIRSPIGAATRKKQFGVGMVLAITAAISFLVACDGGSPCNEGYRALEAGVRCSELGATCYQNSEGNYCQLERAYSIEECQRQGGEAISDPCDGSLLRGGCPNGRRVLAYIDFGVFLEGGLCCALR
jgi:hypothetical protein